MILMTNNHLYTIKPNPPTITPNYETKYALELVTENVMSIGAAFGYFYYINKERELYLLWGTTIDSEDDDLFKEEKDHMSAFEFKCVSRVKSVCVDMSRFYYVNLEGECFQVQGWSTSKTRLLPLESKQIVVKDLMWFILYENGRIDIYDGVIEKTVTTLESNYTQLHTNWCDRYGPVYALDRKLDLYMIKTPRRDAVPETKFELVGSNVLNMLTLNYLVCLPMSGDDNLF